MFSVCLTACSHLFPLGFASLFFSYYYYFFCRNMCWLTYNLFSVYTIEFFFIVATMRIVSNHLRGTFSGPAQTLISILASPSPKQVTISEWSLVPPPPLSHHKRSLNLDWSKMVFWDTGLLSSWSGSFLIKVIIPCHSNSSLFTEHSKFGFSIHFWWAKPGSFLLVAGRAWLGHFLLSS